MCDFVVNDQGRLTNDLCPPRLAGVWLTVLRSCGEGLFSGWRTKGALPPRCLRFGFPCVGSTVVGCVNPCRRFVPGRTPSLSKPHQQLFESNDFQGGINCVCLRRFSMSEPRNMSVYKSLEYSNGILKSTICFACLINGFGSHA